MSAQQVSTTNLLGANRMVDAIVEGLRAARAAGIEVSVQDMAVAALGDVDDGPGRARHALVLAVCLARLADQ